MKVNGNEVQVIYEYGKGLDCGRIYPQRMKGLQAFPSDVRAALASKYYWDVDMVNSQPVILLAKCKEFNWPHKYLEEYVLKRSIKLSELMDELQCTRDDAKQFCLAILFGSKPYKNIPEYFYNLINELSIISNNCWDKFPKFAKWASKKPNPKASCLAYWIQNEEALIMNFIDSLLASKGRYLATNIHDGGLVLKKESETEFPVMILRELENQVREHFEIQIALDVKPLTHSYKFEGNNSLFMRGIVMESEYQLRKEEFEENVFFCLETKTTCHLVADELRHISKSDGGAYFASYNFEIVIDNIIRRQSFFNDWIDDPKKRTINKLVFKPQGCEENEFNLYRGMAGSVETAINQDIIERFKLLVYHNANKDDIMNDYHMKWYAHLVQKPAVIPGVVLIFVNNQQGTGKDTITNFFGKCVVGEKYFKNIQNARDEVFNTHSQVREQCLFMKFEEANGYDNRQFSDMLKSLVTCGTALINAKGVKPYSINTFPHLCMTTNNCIPVKVEADDRRFCITKTSAEFIGNVAFWNETYKLFEMPEAGHSVWKYLMGIDLSNFNVKDFPKNDYHEGLAHVEIGSTESFAAQLEVLEECTATELHEAYKQYCSENGLVARNCVWFCRELSSISKIRRKVVHKQSRYYI